MTGPRVLVVFTVLMFVWTPPVAARQAPPPTAEQLATYETFRAWVTRQSDLRGAGDEVVYRRYAAELIQQGQTAPQAEATITLLKQLGDRAEIERWNRILTAEKPRFNTEPNAFLVEMIKGVKPGRSLDVGMGRGGIPSISRARAGSRSVSIRRTRPSLRRRNRRRSSA